MASHDSNSEGKLDYEGFLSPLVLRRYAEYMHQHREQADGKLQASDNWQKGIPLNAYMKSLWRHFMVLWTLHRGSIEGVGDREDACCTVIFNASGYLHELLDQRRAIELVDYKPKGLSPWGKPPLGPDTLIPVRGKIIESEMIGPVVENRVVHVDDAKELPQFPAAGLMPEAGEPDE